MKTLLACVLIYILGAWPAYAQSTPAWRGFAGDEQHNANALAPGQTLTTVHWTTRIDLHPTSYIHYGSPMITQANTIIIPVKTGTAGSFNVEALSGAAGKQIWSIGSDYALPPSDWIPSFPAHLTAQNRLYYAGDGGTVYSRIAPDSKKGKTTQLAFFGLTNYQANPAAYNNHVMIDTPITADSRGNIFFGFVVTGSTPLNLQSGIARVSADGKGTWISATSAAADKHITQVAMNCAPAVSRDQKTIYIAVSNGTTGYLVGLDSDTLQPKYSASLKDPVSGKAATVYDDSSASPTIGLDNDVFYGVLESPSGSHNCRGWLLHFDSALAKKKTPGSFGWDDTVSVVPASAVPSYAGKSSYLLVSKYNNYLGCGSGDGHNRMAILDPDAGQKDDFSRATVMKEVLTILNPNQVEGEPQGAVYEWCVNSVVVDATNQSVIANAEDGYSYRWDLATNTLSQMLDLNPPQTEAYTPTLIGPDGTVYALNQGTLFAMGN